MPPDDYDDSDAYDYDDNNDYEVIIMIQTIIMR